MAQLPNKLKEFLETMSLIEDEQDRMLMLIDYSDKFKEVPSSIARRPYPEDRKVPFCESEAYVFSGLNDDGSVTYYYAVENPQGVSAKALCAIFDDTLSGEKPEAILNIPLDIVYDIFGRSLSMGKNLGLTGILQMMQRDAKKFIQEKEFKYSKTGV